MQICNETEQEFIDRAFEVGLTSSQEDYLLESALEISRENRF